MVQEFAQDEDIVASFLTTIKGYGKKYWVSIPTNSIRLSGMSKGDAIRVIILRKRLQQNTEIKEPVIKQ